MASIRSQHSSLVSVNPDFLPVVYSAFRRLLVFFCLLSNFAEEGFPFGLSSASRGQGWEIALVNSTNLESVGKLGTTQLEGHVD